MEAAGMEAPAAKEAPAAGAATLMQRVGMAALAALPERVDSAAKPPLHHHLEPRRAAEDQVVLQAIGMSGLSGCLRPVNRSTILHQVRRARRETLANPEALP
jgi:hypothetical protein